MFINLGLGFEFGSQRIRDLAFMCPQSLKQGIQATQKLLEHKIVQVCATTNQTETFPEGQMMIAFRLIPNTKTFISDIDTLIPDGFFRQYYWSFGLSNNVYYAEKLTKRSSIPYAHHYNPRFVYFLPHFSLQFILKSSLYYRQFMY